MGCLLWIHNLNKVLAFSLSYCVQYHVIFQHDMSRVYHISSMLVIERLQSFAKQQAYFYSWLQTQPWFFTFFGHYNFEYVIIVQRTLFKMAHAIRKKLMPLESSHEESFIILLISPWTKWSPFSDAFSWMKRFVFWFKFHWSLFLRDQLTMTQHWFW